MLGSGHQQCRSPKSTPEKFRVIIDLSRPEGASVNDQLLRELPHVAYSSIEDASFAMHTLGPGAQLAKIDSVRLPITASLMRRIKAQLSLPPTSFLKVLIWAVCSVGFFGFLRAGEFLIQDVVQFDSSRHLSLADIVLDTSAPRWRFLVTDQYFQGAQVVLGATEADLCPVAALLDYLSSRGDSPGPLFMFSDGSRCTAPGLFRKFSEHFQPQASQVCTLIATASESERPPRLELLVCPNRPSRSSIVGRAWHISSIFAHPWMISQRSPRSCARVSPPSSTPARASGMTRAQHSLSCHIQFYSICFVSPLSSPSQLFGLTICFFFSLSITYGYGKF